ncbi:hypothetical protein [Mycobacteroides abscessus]|uniref:hypothetical protein n=1 Tax=Mycobacteroides abscessus TaxID=36809 RepID=UPI002105E30B|nr:hypothetical protein [Mycobacteroides abscessus]
MTVPGKFNVIAVAAVLASGAGVAASKLRHSPHLPQTRESGPVTTESKALALLREHVQDWALFGTGAVLDDYVLDGDGQLAGFVVLQPHIYRYPSYRLGKVAALLTDVLGQGQQWTVTADPLEGTVRVTRGDQFSKAAA